MPQDVKVPFIRECELYGADVNARRRPDHRCRPHRRREGQAARLVRRLDAEGAVPHRGQEDDGLRARRAARLAVPRLDHLSDRRRHRHGRHVEGVRGDGADRLEGAGTPAEDGLGAGRALRADRPRVRAGRRAVRDVAERADGGRRPARAEGDRRLPRAARRPRERRHRDRRLRRRHGRATCARWARKEGISAAPEGGAALHALRVLLATAASSPPTRWSSSTPAAR